MLSTAHTYICTKIHTYVRTFIHAYMRTCVLRIHTYDDLGCVILISPLRRWRKASNSGFGGSTNLAGIDVARLSFPSNASSARSSGIQGYGGQFVVDLTPGLSEMPHRVRRSRPVYLCLFTGDKGGQGRAKSKASQGARTDKKGRDARTTQSWRSLMQPGPPTMPRMPSGPGRRSPAFAFALMLITRWERDTRIAGEGRKEWVRGKKVFLHRSSSHRPAGEAACFVLLLF
jgi:hypothetical protein